MITNPEILKNAFKCDEIVARYLIYNCHIPVFGYDEDCFYFAKTEKLKECLEQMPLGLKILSIFKGRR